MDRSLDDIVTERHRGGGRGRRGGGGGRRNDRNDYPRDGVRKARPTRSHTSSSILILLVTSRILLGPGRSPSPAIRTSDDGPEKYTQMNTSLTQAFLVFPQSFREDNRNIDSDWVHDKYDDNSGRRPVRAERRYSPEQVYETASAKLRVENLHYDLTEEDLDDLFNRIGPVQKLTLTYDRAGRSEGVAYVTYESAQDAKLAIREFDGANAKGQPIRLSAVPAGPSGGRSRNPFDYAVAPPRSLADRITVAPGARSRSLSPIRHSDVSGPPPANVDRYVPGQNRRSRSPLPRRERREGGRRPGVRRERGDRGSGRGGGERIARDGRPKKTQEELDAEMEDYWGNKGKDDGAETTETAAAVEPQDDIDMIS